MLNLPAETIRMIADLKGYALENYSTVPGMDYAVEAFDTLDWVIIVNKSKGDFNKAVALLKAKCKLIADYDAEIASTAF
jgi:hypothetical protein